MPGDELGRRIRQDKRYDRMRMIMASSAEELGDAGRVRQIGFDAYLLKPVRRSTLYERIAIAAGRRAEKQPPAWRGATAGPSERPGLRILVAEDNQINQVLTVAILEREGHRVDTVANGAEAVAAVARFPYDLVLMDVHMPEMDGIEATRQIRALPEPWCRIPVIAVTANAMEGDREYLIGRGMDDYMAKPVDIAELVRMVRRVEDQHGRQSELVDATGDEPPMPAMSAMSNRTAPAAPPPPHLVQAPPVANDVAVAAARPPPPEAPVRAAASARPDVVLEDATLQVLSARLGRHGLARLVRAFVAEAGLRGERIEAAATVGDLEELRHEAHALARGAAGLGLNRLAAAAFQIERAARDGGGREAARRAEDLDGLLGETLAALGRRVATAA